MPLRIPLALGLGCAILLIGASKAFAWGEAATREIARGAVAGCLRAAGDETIAVTGAPTRRNLPYDVLGLGNLELRETLQLGKPFSCPHRIWTRWRSR